MMRKHNSKIMLALAGSLALAGCEVAPEDAAEHGADAGTDDVESARSENQSVAELQELEVEPGHTLSLWRFDDGTTVLAEVGDKDVHEGLLSDSTVSLPLSEIARIVAPEVAMEQLLAGRTDDVAPPPDIDSPEPLSMTPSTREAKSTDPITSKGSLPGSYAANNHLHCSDRVTAEAADAPVTYCRSGNTSLTTPTETCGYFRSNALYEGNTGSATYVLYRQGLFGSWSNIAQVQLNAKQWGRMYYLSPTKSTLYAKISASTNQSVSISSHATEVAPRAQENPNWCWLASAQMAMATIGQNREQCNMADFHWGRPSASEAECCRAWSDDSSYVEGDPGCDGGGEACQALTENGMTWTYLSQADVNDPLVLEQALQNGPVIIWDPSGPHYSVLSDYREFLVGGTWVPHALHSNPWGPNDYDTGSHMSWVRLDRVGRGNGGFVAAGLSDIRARGSYLKTKLHRVSWHDNVATAYFFAPGAQRYEYEFRDSGGNVVDGNIWAQGTVNAPGDVKDGENCWQPDAARISTASLNVSGWLWYSVKVRACSGSSCGAWAYERSVSRAPIASIGTVTGTWNGSLRIPVTAQAAPEETFFRYRVTNAASTTTYRSGKVNGSATRFATSATIRVSLPLGVDANVQVQACSGNGCSDWATRTVHTGSYFFPAHGYYHTQF